MKKSAITYSSFYYSVNMLKIFKGMNLITDDEAEKITESLAEHYNLTDIYYR